jgi:formylglycine-generating enzyme required for sulfatase activity
MPHDVFISHSSKDKVVADAVCAMLEAAGIRCWIAPRDIFPGANWGEAIIDALSTSKAMVLIFSANSNESGQVVREVERAINKNIPVIPFRIENVPLSKAMEYFISTAHWLDAFPLYEKHLAVLSQRLVGLIQSEPGDARAERSLTAPPRLPSRQARGIGKPLLIGGGIAAVVSVAITWAVLNGSGGRNSVEKPERPPVAVEPPPVAGMAPDAAAAQDTLKQELATARAAAEELKLRNDQAAREKAAAEAAARIAQQEKEVATAEKARLEREAKDAAMAARRLAEDKQKAEAEAQKAEMEKQTAIEKMKADQIEQQAAAAAAAAAETKRSLEAALSQAVSSPGVDCEWVAIGDPRNKSDNTGFGAVSYPFEISKTPITNLQYADFLNTSSRGRTNDAELFHESMSSSRQGGIRQVGQPGAFRYEIKLSMADDPVNFVSWFAAVRMANWLHNGGTVDADTEKGAYVLGEGAGGESPVPESTARFRLPSEDEWYKAAYFRGGDKRAGYWRYAGGNDVFSAADETCYGVCAIAKGFGEWNDAVLAGGRRGVRGVEDPSGPGDDRSMKADFRGPGCQPDTCSPFIGFRLVRLREPTQP